MVRKIIVLCPCLKEPGSFLVIAHIMECVNSFVVDFQESAVFQDLLISRAFNEPFTGEVPTHVRCGSY